MKHTWTPWVLALLLLVTGCGITGMTPQEKERTAQLVQQKLDERSFQIYVNYMIPFRGSGRAIDGSYSIIVDGSTIDSHLPYVGAARNVPYGGGKVLTFKDDIDEYVDYGIQRRGDRVIAFLTDNDEDKILYTLTITATGRAHVDIHCQNREDISFRGFLELPKD